MNVYKTNSNILGPVSPLYTRKLVLFSCWAKVDFCSTRIHSPVKFLLVKNKAGPPYIKQCRYKSDTVVQVWCQSNLSTTSPARQPIQVNQQPQALNSSCVHLLKAAHSPLRAHRPWWLFALEWMNKVWKRKDDYSEGKSSKLNSKRISNGGHF